MSTNSMCPVYDEYSPIVPDGLIEHSRIMAPEVYNIADKVYLAYGYGLGSPAMIVGDDGIIIIDPNECEVKSRRVLEAFRKITDKPVVAVIYTHFHADHIFGVRAFASPEDVAAGRIQIISHETLPYFMALQSSSGIGTILGLRNSYTFGQELPVAEDGRINNGIGPDNIRGKDACGYIAPTLTFRDTLDITIAGVRLHLLWVPSECEDEIAVWLPDYKILHTAEVVQGECFPNLHTIRGTRYRNPRTWYKSLDKLRSFGAEYMVPAHGRPTYGKEAVEEVLRSYRDGIQYVYDQTIRLMNRGYTARELAHMVALPEHLAKHRWLGEYYGAVYAHVQEIYQGELGFFDGDPTTLQPTPPVESARRHLALMGGRDTVLAEARKAGDAGDWHWAAELTTYIIRVDNDDMEARLLKAQAMRQIGYTQTAIHIRNWYLCAALELEGKAPGAGYSYGGYPAVTAGFPAKGLLDGMSMQLLGDETLDLHLSMAFEVDGERCALEIRRGVAEFHESPTGKEDVVVRLPKPDLDLVFCRRTSFEKCLEEGSLQIVAGSREDALLFFSKFEWPTAAGIRLTIR